MGSEDELLDAVRQPVVTLSVKDLLAKKKKRVSRQSCTWQPRQMRLFAGVMGGVLQESECDTLLHTTTVQLKS